MYMNQNSALFFAPLRVSSVRPFCGPSQGGTMISLIGTGFKDTGVQSIRFKFANHTALVAATYDPSSNCFHAHTPNFEVYKTADQLPLSWPQICKIELSLDGVYFTPCEHDFFIYNSKIQVPENSPLILGEQSEHQVCGRQGRAGTAAARQQYRRGDQSAAGVPHRRLPAQAAQGPRDQVRPHKL